MDGCIFLYFYSVGKSHRSADTDRYIIASVRESGIKCTSVMRSELGKPFLAEAGVFVSVSHSASLLTVAVANHSIGVDIERGDREVRDISPLVKRWFSAAESESILSLNGEERRREFIKTWVKKEAAVKECGVGISGIRDADTAELEDKFTVFEYKEHIGAVYSSVGCKNYKIIDRTVH